jgi:DNA adenine methylase
MQFSTPLRYPGGKGRLGPWLAQLLRHNRISGGCYVEPYAGGAGAAIYLLTKGYVDHIVINDADPVVYAFWAAAVQHTDQFLQLLDATPVNMDTWYRQKAIHEAPQNHDLVEVGFATFFLNRTNRSGILAGGVIGGKAQQGPYKLDARFNKVNLRARIELLGSMRRHIGIYGADALDFLGQIEGQLPANSLIYFDPPYFHKGSQLYRNYYDPEDHQHIALAVGELNRPWLVSYDDCPEIREIYDGHRVAEFSLVYSTAETRPRGSEVMFYNGVELHGLPTLRR